MKDSIREEFKYIKSLMNFDKKCHEIFRTWYIDGRVFYHKVIDLDNPSEGIQDIRYIDPLKIRLVRETDKTGQIDYHHLMLQKMETILKILLLQK